MLAKNSLATGLAIFLISGCASFQQKEALQTGKFCAKSPEKSAVSFIKSVSTILLDEGWNLMLSVIAAPFHPLEVLGAPGNKELGLSKMRNFVEYPGEENLRPGDEANQSLFLVGALEPTENPEKKIAPLEARYRVILRGGRVLPEEVWQRKFFVFFLFPGNCIYRIEELDQEWKRIK